MDANAREEAVSEYCAEVARLSSLSWDEFASVRVKRDIPSISVVLSVDSS